MGSCHLSLHIETAIANDSERQILTHGHTALDYAKRNLHITVLLRAMGANQKSHLSSEYRLSDTNTPHIDRLHTQTKIETEIETKGGGGERKREISNDSDRKREKHKHKHTQRICLI